MIPVADIQRVRDTLRAQIEGGHCDDAMDTLATAAIESGGSMNLTRPDSNLGPHANEVTAYGVSAFGGEPAELLRNWTKAATALLDCGADITPIQAAIVQMEDDTAPDAFRLSAALAVLSKATTNSRLHGRAADIATLLRTEMGAETAA